MPAVRIPLPFDDVFTTADLPQAGVSTGALQGWRARGEVVELCAGVYIRADAELLEAKRTVYASRPIALGHRPVTLAGAAFLYDLPLPSAPHSSWKRDERHVRIPSDHLKRVRGLLVPSLAWTAISLARWQQFHDALVPLDAALRRGCSVADLTSCAASLGAAKGTRFLQRAVSLGDARSESPLESCSRGLMLEARVPSPELQREIRTRAGTFRVDFCWPDVRVIGEADGRVKYSDADTLWREKLRQEHLERAGYRVVRWTWHDITAERRRWLDRLHHALAHPE